jgi:glycosyltransferase involved in cell wall biosynthesis
MSSGSDKKILFLSALTTDSGSGVRFWNMARVVADAGWPVTFLERCPPRLPGRSHPGIDYRSTPDRSGSAAGLVWSLLRSLREGLRLVEGRNLAETQRVAEGQHVAEAQRLTEGEYLGKERLLGREQPPEEDRQLTNDRQVAGACPWRAVYALKPLPNAVLPALRAARRGARIVLDVDDLDFAYYPPGPQRALVRRWFRSWPRRFDAVSYHVEPLREYLLAEPGVPAERLCRIPQGVDLDVFAAPPSPLPAEIEKFTRRHATIVYMASLGITSDFEDVLPALARILGRHPGWGLLVLGHGVRLERFREQAAGLGVAGRVLFAGYLAHDAVPSVLRACRAGFHYLRPAGANRYRAIMKIREYLAAGLPVLANPSADSADFQEFIELAEGEEAVERALAAAVAGERAERTAAGRRFIEERLAWPRLAPDILGILGLTR